MSSGNTLEASLDIILASKSPRREELLKKVVSLFQVVPSEVDEEQFRDRDAVRFAMRAAEAKARDVAEKFPQALVLGADTLVCLEKEILGKPKDRFEARHMLRKLSGQRHRVITAIVFFKKDENRLLADCEISYVRFKSLSEEEIESYLDSGEFADKAASNNAFLFVAYLEPDNIIGKYFCPGFHSGIFKYEMSHPFIRNSFHPECRLIGNPGHLLSPRPGRPVS